MCKEQKQDYLDVAKYYASEKAHDDLSGVMNYCYLCPNSEDGYCQLTQEERERYNICAIMNEFSCYDEPHVVRSLYIHRVQH